MVVEVDVQGGNDNLVVVVLDVGERGLDVLLVVVVNESDGTGDFVFPKVLGGATKPARIMSATARERLS